MLTGQVPWGWWCDLVGAVLNTVHGPNLLQQDSLP